MENSISSSSAPVVLGKRYELYDSLGTGGMGTVFRAGDRLTGKVVALKQVAVPTDQILHAGRAGVAGHDLALAEEFQLLATVRYPHIISVYDFGFGRRGQPYYTMEYLAGSRTILESGKNQTVLEKAALIIQMLQALLYLHRRGILHRDLKPTNALVLDGRLRLLDFGISVKTEHTVEHLTQSTSGTLAYLAPEIFQGEAYSQASDLYAVGLIAFQLFCGEFPYNESNLATLLYEIVSKPLDAAAYGIDANLTTVLNRLVAKTREVRYPEAAEVIYDLSAALELPLPAETVEIRDSFLQAAKFVGRQKELGDLTARLEAAANGRGSVVLISGESGVGKSRLLDELRVRALVGGMLVLQGQAISNGRSPFQLWVEVFRSLALFGQLDLEEAATLRPFVPDLERLAGRELSREVTATRQDGPLRLAQTLSRLLGRMDQPVMILLEDLQWAMSESLQLLADLAAGVGDLAVFLVGSYRDDEPMPAYQPLAHVTYLKLDRLAEEEIAELCVSMLGRAGADPALVALLMEETEGNAFFLVEAMRNLAEDAGNLDRVSKMSLPDSFAAGGVRAILNRRLDRVPDVHRPLMKLASVAGRQIDLALLHALEPEVDLDPWLAALAEVSVIEVQGESWRFAHDKLREEIRESLGHEEHHILHRRVAEGLEAIYPDAAEQAANLAYHWAVAGNRDKERYYDELAGRQAAEKDAGKEAIVYFERALELLRQEPESAERDRQEQAILREMGPQLRHLVRGHEELSARPDHSDTY